MDGNVRDRPFICKFESFSRRDDFLHGYMREGELEKNRRKKQRDRIVIIQIGSERFLDRPRHDPLVMQPTRVYAGPFLPGDE